MGTRTGRWLAAGLVAIATTFGATAIAVADGTADDNSAAPYAVEDFAYPGTSPLPNVKLIQGDGHIVLGDCAAGGQIRVLSPDIPGDGMICFRATASTGYLTVEIPNVIFIKAEEHAVRASLTSDGVTQTVNIAKDDGASVGRGSGTGPRTPAALLELRVTS
ncbi:hypothetical protein [Kitasatospora sp. NPDC057223]|uniref:hypothetical protein n=1 Tax=Kitasatospora sp. NPDC057223 TaxID=3346055 RepID=UPI0036261B8E